MSKFKRHEVVYQAWQTGIIPIFSDSDVEINKKVANACYRGGIRLFEFTNRVPFAHEVFRELRDHVTANCPEMILGVGSIVEPATAALYIQMEADFVVCPVLSHEVIKICNRRKIACIPGCCSASEISQAEEYGADIIKIFPGSVLGPSFVSGHLAPCPWSSLMPTGGVEPNLQNIETWFKAGVHCVGIGSKLIDNNSIESGNYQALEKRVSELVNWVMDFRS